jgi:hypothetical protein
MRALGIGLGRLPKLPDIDTRILRVSGIAPQLAQREFVRVTGSPPSASASRSVSAMRSRSSPESCRARL